jgi:hypothetical protein
VSVEANRGFVSGGARHRLFVVYPTYAHLHEIKVPSGYWITVHGAWVSEGMLLVENINDGLRGVVNRYGEFVVPAKYNAVQPFSEGMAAVRVGNHATGLWGFIDINGREVIPPRYNHVNNFYNGFAQVRVGASSENSRNWRFGFVNRMGVEIAQPIYHQVYNFSGGFANVRGDDVLKWGFINEMGNLAIPFQFPSISYFYNGFALVMEECCGIFWRHNDLPMCGARVDGMLLIDEKGKEVRFIHHACPTANSIVRSGLSHALSEGVIWVRNPQTNLLGLVDLMGNTLMPFKYNSTRGFSEGMAWVSVTYQQKNLWALIDSKGNEIIRPIYDYVEDFSEGLAAVWRDGYVGFIDKEGNEVIEPNQFNNAGSFINGLAPVQINDIRRETWDRGQIVDVNYGLWGFIDTSGNIVVPLEYTGVRFDGSIMMLGGGASQTGGLSLGGPILASVTPNSWRAYKVTFETFPPNN